MNKKEIIKAWAHIRTTNNTIPDDVLDFMKDSAIEKLDRKKTQDWDKFSKIQNAKDQMKRNNDILLKRVKENTRLFESIYYLVSDLSPEQIERYEAELSTDLWKKYLPKYRENNPEEFNNEGVYIGGQINFPGELSIG